MKVHKKTKERERHFSPLACVPSTPECHVPTAIPDLSTDSLTIRPWPDDVIDALGH
ncbi:MAG: hypothetical protein QOD30_69, partial [Actinomycetota bacterium]|nr:hypothetical protein [Actinomycetota bacterium]